MHASVLRWLLQGFASVSPCRGLRTWTQAFHFVPLLGHEDGAELDQVESNLSVTFLSQKGTVFVLIHLHRLNKSTTLKVINAGGSVDLESVEPPTGKSKWSKKQVSRTSTIFFWS